MYGIMRTKIASSTVQCNGRAVARSENPEGLVVLGGDNVFPLVQIGLTNLLKTGGAKPGWRRPCTCRGVSGFLRVGGQVVMGGDNVSPLVEIGLTDLPKSGGAIATPAPPSLTPLFFILS